MRCNSFSLLFFFCVVLHWQIYNIVAINHHYSFFSHWFCLMILFSFLFRCNCKAMWLISSYPPVGGISGQINIFASHIVQVYFGIFFSFCWPDINRNITLYCINFPFFHLIIVFWLEWKSTRQPLLIFSSICLFSFCCVFISISIFKIYLCAVQSLSLSCCMRIVILLWNSFQWNDYAILFLFYHCLFVVTSQLLCLFLETITTYIRCEGELMINWKEKKLWKFSSPFHRNIANGFLSHLVNFTFFMWMTRSYQMSHTNIPTQW